MYKLGVISALKINVCIEVAHQTLDKQVELVRAVYQFLLVITVRRWNRLEEREQRGGGHPPFDVVIGVLAVPDGCDREIHLKEKECGHVFCEKQTVL